jgi:hypothetical protein
MFTLRQLFDEKEISYEYNAKRFVMHAIKKIHDDDLDFLAINEPDIFEVFVRRTGGMRTRVTASGATGSSSGASPSRSSVSTSGSSGGSTSRLS